MRYAVHDERATKNNKITTKILKNSKNKKKANKQNKQTKTNDSNKH